MTAIRTTALRRVFAPSRRSRRAQPADERVALDALDLEIPAGEVHGLLGPNGAGKTTLCKILCTVLVPTAGSAEVAGFDVLAATLDVRRRVGVVLGGERGLYTRLTARQNLLYWAAMYGNARADGRRLVDRLIERVGLVDRADERVETFSRGMKQRVHLARGLVGDPEVVVLDEPTVGMDPVAAREFRALVTELRGERRTILLTTHDMAEAEAVCDRVSLIDGGRLIGTADPRVIGSWVTRYERVVAHAVPADVVARVRALPGVAAVVPLDRDGAGRGNGASGSGGGGDSSGGGSAGAVRIETDADGAAARVLQLLVAAGVTRVSTSVPDLEEVYLHVIGDRGLIV